MHQSLFSQSWRYILFGLVTAGLEFSTFLFVGVWMHIYIASVVSFAVGLIASFLFNKFIVFKSSSAISKKEVLQFIGLGVLNSQLSAILTVAVSLFAPVFVAKSASIACIAAWNYVIMRMIIFRKSPLPEK